MPDIQAFLYRLLCVPVIDVVTSSEERVIDSPRPVSRPTESAEAMACPDRVTSFPLTPTLPSSPTA